MKKLNAKDAVTAINRHGILLTFPLANRPDPLSLWRVAYPRSPMRWEWDDGGDDRVARLWHLREELSRSRKVVYAKWLQGRATFFSRPAFVAVRALGLARAKPLSRDSRTLLETLTESSPRSTKELKRATELVGRALEPTYERALRALWEELAIVAFGEIDEGAFPSLAIGATALLFEELEEEARQLPPEAAWEFLAPLRERSPAIERQLRKLFSAPFLTP